MNAARSDSSRLRMPIADHATTLTFTQEMNWLRGATKQGEVFIAMDVSVGRSNVRHRDEILIFVAAAESTDATPESILLPKGPF
jgi:hypothetical protein